MALQVQSVYKDPLLSNISVRYTNAEFIADSVAPIVTVPKRSGVYFTYNKENLRPPVSTARADFARANRADYDMTQTPYGPLLERSLEIGIPKDELEEAQQPADLRVDAALTVTEKVMLEKEVGLATYLASTSNITNNTTLSGTSQWSDQANSVPFTNVQTWRSSMIAKTVIPNSAVMGQQVWDILKNHPDLLERVKYSQLAVLTTDLLCTLFEVGQVFIGRAVQNTVVEGQTDATSFVWGKNFQLLHIAPQPGIRTLSAIYHLTLEGARYIDRWEELERKAEFIRFNDYYSRQVVAQEAIYLGKNVVA